MNFDDSGFFGQRTTGAEQADNQPSQPQSGAQNLSRFLESLSEEQKTTMKLYQTQETHYRNGPR